jgi:hypothetical protein
MGLRRRGIQVLGWLSLIAGAGFALLLIRGIYTGFTRGFGASRSQAIWIALGYVLCFAFAAYLVCVGRHAISLAKGLLPPKARFGWGRIILGAIFLYFNAARHFHLIPAHFKPSPSNLTEGVIFIGCVLLIFSGVWRGLRRQIQPSVSVC